MENIENTIMLDSLREGIPSFTPEFGSILAQVASFCLENQNHRCSVQMTVNGEYNDVLSLSWESVTDQIRRNWNDLQEATEFGAVGIAILLIIRLTEYTVVQRAWKGTGFDYWLGYKNDILFQNKARLEVSGILKGDKKMVEYRVNQKIKQVETYDSPLPAFIIVVEFSNPISRIHKNG